MCRSDHGAKRVKAHETAKPKLNNTGKTGDESRRGLGTSYVTLAVEPQHLLGAKRVKAIKKGKLRLENTIKPGGEPTARSGYEVWNSWGRAAVTTGCKSCQIL